MPKSPIAVVGLGGIFPGADSPQTLWKNILARFDATREVPPERWVMDPAQAVARPGADRVASTRACLVEPFAVDPTPFGIDFEQLDPVYSLALVASATALGEAVTKNLDRRRIGVMLASIALPTDRSSELTQQLFSPTLEGNLTGQAKSPPRPVHPANLDVVGLPAALVARCLNLGGSSLTLDAACASSLYAIKLACDELEAGRADAMLAGGVSRPDCLYTQMGFTALGALSPTGHCSPFDRKGDGLVVGEGAGVVVLKRLEDALRDGDTIYGLLRGIGLSNDLGGSLLAPSHEGQLRAMRDAYAQAGWRPNDVELIECHGTGTPMGDRIEIESLRALWQDEPFRPGQCSLGSVKSMIGHLLTAAGAAGLIKVLMALRDQILPPMINFSQPGKDISLEGGPFKVQTEPEPWADPGHPRRAAVSAFGFGGINAHVLVEEWVGQQPVAVEPEPSAPVAIVAVASRFGKLKTQHQFMQTVFAGGSAIEARPATRWNGNPLGPIDTPGAYIDQLEIPVGKFRLPPSDIPSSLPQQLLMLEVAAQAAEQAGLDRAPKARAGAVIGINLDADTTNFHLRWAVDALIEQWGAQATAEEREKLRQSASPPLDSTRTLGALGSIVASRLARELAVGGPSFAISAGEASGIRALEVAVRALQKGELDTCLVGAVDLAGDPRAVLAAHQRRRLAPDGKVKPFAAEATGSAVGEGAVALVVKRLADAERAGDQVLAVVRGMGAGSGSGAYQLALERAYAEAGVDPGRVSLVEAAATGDADEDAYEAGELSRFFGAGLPLALGSVTPFVGQTGAVSGLASLAKAVGCLQESLLPPLPGFERPAQNWPAHIHFPRQASFWYRNRQDGPRLAGVSSVNGQGEAYHVVLEGRDAPSAHLCPAGAPRAALFWLDITELDQLARLEGELQLRARSWHQGHRRQPKRPLALVARTVEELELAIEQARLAVAKGERRQGQAGVFYSPEPLKGQVAFLYPGSGNHFAGMTSQLMVAFPEVARQLDATTDRLADHAVPELIVPYRQEWGEGWQQRANRAIEADAHAPIFGQVMAGITATRVVNLFGLEPQAVIGYSLGESAGLFSSGVWTERDVMFGRIMNSDLFTRQLGGECLAAKQRFGPDFVWKVAVVNRPAAAVRQALVEGCDLLIVNTAEECVIGGHAPAVAATVEQLGCDAFYLEGITTVHSRVLEPVKQAYYDLHLLKTTPKQGLRFYSGNWAKAFEPSAERAAQSIVDNALKGIDYAATIEAAYADGVRIFLEMGPHGSCARMVGRILGDRPHLARSVSLPGEPETFTLLKLLAAAAAEGLEIDMSPLYDLSELAPEPESRGVVTVPIGKNLPTPLATPIAPQTPVSRANGRPAPTPTPVAPPPAARATRPAPAAVSTQALEPLAAQMLETSTATAKAHQTFLRMSGETLEAMARAVELQNQLLAQLVGEGELPASLTAPEVRVEAPRDDVLWDYDQCMEFAVGSIAKVLGPKFAEVDHHPTRVRLPDEPLMLCHRITHVEGEPGSLGSGRLVTEHDVHHDAWYLDAGRTPVCISVEAGQADLFLSAYLGIDLRTRGHRMYRLLDATVEFHRGLPQPGERIVYDIRIDRFVRQGDVYLFFFEFDGTIDGQKLITMRNGCAGFFTYEEIENSGGIVLTAEERKPAAGHRQADWRDLAPLGGVESYDDARVAAFRRGDPAACFGPAFANLPLRRPYGLPDGRMKLFDRVLSLDPRGGRFGLGTIQAEADIHPDDWFLTCHFVDDMVMPGTLMYECCAHTLRFLLARIGWLAEVEQVAFEPVLETPAALQCRGPVDVDTKKVVYQVDIKAIGYNPAPYVIADALMFGDGKPIVRFVDMSMQLTGVTRAEVEALWQSQPQPQALYDKQSIMEFSNGRPSLAFGEPYTVFDSERRIARLPGPPYQFMDRVVEVNQPPFVLQSGGWIESHYDVPPNAWYFEANHQSSMAYCILLEAALQPCGWLAAYVGSALRSRVDTHFRNLGGTATLHHELFPDVGTVRVRVRMSDVSEAGGMIIENFEMQMLAGDRLLYEGTTYFGFFTGAALSNQLGVRDAGERVWTPSAEQLASARSFELARLAPLDPDDSNTVAGEPMPGGALLMMDRVDAYLPQGGPRGLGFIRGSKTVNPDEWFFKAHFYQDPVWPGSLGLEAFLQLLKVVALDRWPQSRNTHRFEPIAVGEPHTWVYRGQVIPSNKKVVVEAYVSHSSEHPHPTLKADGFLVVDGLTIYEMKDFSIRLVPTEGR